MTKNKKNRENGFSLIELLVVIIIIGLLAALSYSRMFGGSDGAAGENILRETASKIADRRDSAIRLNGNRERTSLETQIAPLVEIDFGNLETTASLVIDGTDSDDNSLNDESGEQLTHLRSDKWVYSYRNNPLELKSGWRVLAPEEEVPVPMIGEYGQGDRVTRIGFDGDGRAFAFQNGAWQKYPTSRNASSSATPSIFWAVYLVKTDMKVPQAVAVGVYPSGQIEKFRYDGRTWIGFRSRAVSVGN